MNQLRMRPSTACRWPVSARTVSRVVPVLKPRTLRVTKAVYGGPDKTMNDDDLCSRHPAALKRRQDAEARQRKREAARAETMAQLEGRPSAEMPSNMQIINTVADLENALSSASETSIRTIVGIKARWCSKCARVQYEIKEAAKQHPDSRFLIVDITYTKGEMNHYCKEAGLEKIPYFWIYRGDKMVYEGIWDYVRL